MKKMVSLILVLVLALLSVQALADKSVSGAYYDTETLEGLPPFKFQHMKNGIGKGLCPVYSAPYKDAYRANNGKAAVDSNSYIDVAGFNGDGWLLVRYETNKGNWRVGWIPPEYVKGFKTNMTFHFGRIEQVAEEEIAVTENNKNPNSSRSVIGQIEAGETYYVLGYYNYTGYELWYVEFDLDGETAWGFIFR